MPLDNDPSLPPRPEIPQQMRNHNLLGFGDRTFENSVNRRMHTKSAELKALLTALVAYQRAHRNPLTAREELRALERAVVNWETRHPKEVSKRGRLLPNLKWDIKTHMTRYGMVPTMNNHVRSEEEQGFGDSEHGAPVNLWRKTRSALWAANWVASTGVSTATNLSGGGTLAMVGLGTTLFTVSAATGVGLVIGGCAVMIGSTAIQAKSAVSSYKHRKNLEGILASSAGGGTYCAGLCGNRPDPEEHQMILDSVLPYIISQKRKKTVRRGIGSIPLVSLGETIRSIGRKAQKTWRGTLGKEREDHAMTLAKHLITHDCHLAQAIVAELFSDEEEEWLRYQDFQVVAGILAEKMKSV